MNQATKTKSRPARATLQIGFAPAAHSPGKLLHDAHVLLSAALVRMLRNAGHEISSEQWGILCQLWERDDVPQWEIGERLGKDRHHTSRLIDALEEQGLVARSSKDGDRRVKRVCLTRAGHAARSKLLPLAKDTLERTFEGLTQVEYDCFTRCLRHITSRLQAGKEQGKSGRLP